MPFTGDHSTWQALEMPRSSSTPDLLFADLGIDLPTRTCSNDPHMLANEEFECADILAHDCILSSTAFKIDTEMPWAGPTVPLWPRSYHPSLEPAPISPNPSPQNALQRKEVSRWLLRNAATWKTDGEPETSSAK